MSIILTRKIVYITFSKAAAEEAAERIVELFPDKNKIYIYYACYGYI